jgi:hypothetical protein
MRSMAIVAPVLMLTYGVLRWIDGRDGDRHNGPAWDAGHVAFFVAMVLFAVLAVQMSRLVATVPATIAAGAVVAGVLCFLWVIIGDLFDGFPELAGPLETAGPVLFGLGMVVLMAMLTAARRLPWWSPVLFLAGFLAIPVDLDLLPFASVAILIAFAPLAVARAEPAANRHKGGARTSR